jgi:hypothetical protein
MNNMHAIISTIYGLATLAIIYAIAAICNRITGGSQ